MRYTALFLALLVGCAPTPTPTPNVNYHSEYYESGKRAFKLGIPANANPHIGKPFSGEEWLDGYMDAKESK